MKEWLLALWATVSGTVRDFTALDLYLKVGSGIFLAGLVLGFLVGLLF